MQCDVGLHSSPVFLSPCFVDHHSRMWQNMAVNSATIIQYVKSHPKPFLVGIISKKTNSSDPIHKLMGNSFVTQCVLKKCHENMYNSEATFNSAVSVLGFTCSHLKFEDKYCVFSSPVISRILESSHA